MAKKFIPNGDVDFLVMARSFANTIAGEPARFDVSAEDVAALTGAFARYEEAYQAARAGGRSTLATAAKEEARIACEKIVRRIANHVRASETVDTISKMALGLRERAAKPKVLTVPNESPRLRFVRAIHEAAGSVPEHELKFSSKDFKPKPPGAVRLELFVDLIPTDAKIPEHPGQTRGSRPFYLRSYTRSPIRVVPPMANVPMRVIYWARWADTTGNVGPFSATAIGWTEGGGQYIRYAVPGDKRAKPLEVTIGEAEQDETAFVALLAAQRLPVGARALIDETRRDVRQLEGPIEEAA